MLNSPAIAVDPAFWIASTSAFDLAPLKVRDALEIETFALVVTRQLCLHNLRLVVISFVFRIPKSRRIRGLRRQTIELIAFGKAAETRIRLRRHWSIQEIAVVIGFANNIKLLYLATDTCGRG